MIQMFGKAKCKLCGDSVRFALRHLREKHPGNLKDRDVIKLNMSRILEKFFRYGHCYSSLLQVDKDFMIKVPSFWTIIIIISIHSSSQPDSRPVRIRSCLYLLPLHPSANGTWQCANKFKEISCRVYLFFTFECCHGNWFPKLVLTFYPYYTQTRNRLKVNFNFKLPSTWSLPSIVNDAIPRIEYSKYF